MRTDHGIAEDGVIKSSLFRNGVRLLSAKRGGPSVKTDSAADPELDHPGMCAHLRTEAKASDYLTVQVDEFSLQTQVLSLLCALTFSASL